MQVGTAVCNSREERLLALQPGERIGYVIEGNEVRLVNASTLEHDDPVLDKYLARLGRDLAKHPDRVAVFPASLLERARAMTSGIMIDHESPIEGAIAL